MHFIIVFRRIRPYDIIFPYILRIHSQVRQDNDKNTKIKNIGNLNAASELLRYIDLKFKSKSVLDANANACNLITFVILYTIS